MGNVQNGNMEIGDLTGSAVEEKLSAGRTFFYGLQHVFVSNVWLDPIFVASMVGLPLALASNLVNAIFLAAGIVTLTQATRLARLPIVQGPSAAFDSLMISAGKAGGLPAAGGGILLSAVLVFLMAVTGVIGRLQKWFTPVVSGTVIFIVGIALAKFTMFEFLGGSSGMKTFLTPDTLTMSISTAILVVVLSLFGKGMWKSYSFLIALVIGDIIAMLLGQTNFSGIAGKGWFGLPKVLPYGSLKLDWGVFATFFVAYIVAVIEAMGVYQAASEMTGERLDAKRIRLGFSGEAAGSMLSSLIGGFPTTAYAQNVGLLRLTGVFSRYPVIVAGILFLVLGLIPKAGALLALTPDPVVGGIFLPAVAGLLYTGISIMGRMEKTEVNYTIVGLSVTLAIALPDSFAGRPGVAGMLLSNNVLVGAFSTLLLSLLLIVIPRWMKRGK